MSPSSQIRILVTGATGTLGRHVVAQAASRPQVVCRALSRRPRPADPTPRGAASTVEWYTADLLVDPLEPALDGVDAVIHLASGKGDGDGDVAATARLLEAARATGVGHVVAISIIGCDRIPLPFYASKLRIEALVEAADIPWSIVRVAQFHSFVARLVAVPAGLALPSPVIADLCFQSIDEAEAAEGLVDAAVGPPLGRAPELAGPEVLTLGRAAELWFAARGTPSTLIPVPLSMVADAHSGEPPSSNASQSVPWAFDVLAGYAAALNTPHGERRLGTVTFAAWLAAQAGATQAGGRQAGATQAGGRQAAGRQAGGAPSGDAPR